MDFTDANEQGFRSEGTNYLRFLRALHDEFIFDWYMEVGCRQGKSFAAVRSKTIAVDPVFAIKTNVIGVKPQLSLFQQTSDEFFDSNYLENSGIKLSLSFLDGMHLFEFLLRDFIATERNTVKDGVILLHDCCPWTHIMTTRDLENIPKGPWTGDVWKLIPILQKYRPDLRIDVFDCKPTGLVAVSNLNPQDASLANAYSDILDEFTSIDLVQYTPEKFYGDFSYVSASDEINNGFPLFAPLGRVGEELGNKRVTP